MTQHQSKDIVLSFIDALNAEDFKKARTFADPEIEFIGVMATVHGAVSYFEQMEKLKFKYDIKKVFADGADVCLWYDINIGGKIIPSAGWYHIENGKVRTFRVLFDPRPVL